MWTAIGKVRDQPFVMSLSIGTKGAAKQEEVGVKGIATGILVQGSLLVGEKVRLHERNNARSSSVK